MAEIIDKGRLMVEVGEYEDKDPQGNKKFNEDGSVKMKKKFWPQGELVKFRNADGSEWVSRTAYVDSRLLGAVEVREYWDSANDKPAQQAPYQAPAPANVGYQFADGTAIAPSDVQRYIRAGVAKWPIGQNPPPIPAGY